MKVELLTEQTKNGYNWVYKLLDSTPFHLWDETPDVIESNISWQAGQLLLSTYFHSILCIAGHQKSVLEEVPMKRYSSLFSSSDPSKSVGEIDPEILRNHLSIIHNRSIEIISSLSETDLNQKLESTKTPNPVAATKFEAIDWNIKHTMWHCGQISILKRIVHSPYDFGLKQ